MRKPWIILSLVTLGFIVAACSGSTGSAPSSGASESKPGDASTSAPAPDNAAQPASNATQFNDEAAVRVEVTPLNLDDPSAATIDFRIAMNTHSVDLNYDLTKIATLSSDAGEEAEPVKWDGPGGGGHHVSGTLSFPQLKTRGKSVTLVVRGIADVPERSFVWSVTN